ncbi:MAG: hypothetical protein ACI8TP_001184 [Acidimicrobiales bacterium]|jgi:hypothetical protein
MTDSNSSDELNEEEIRQLDALLANPNLWEEAEATDEDAIVAMIRAEIERSASGIERSTATGIELSPAAEPAVASDNVVSLARPRRWLTPVLSAAALVVALMGVAVFMSFDGREDGVVELALQGTDLAPAATATARIVDLPAGTRIELAVSSLEAAAPGTYYEVWLRQDAEIGVSAGTFHLRGGDSGIELWAGVSADDYPLVTITIQDEAEPASSGRVVLKGLLENG